MLHLALKAFYPEKPPFPFLHVNTTWKFHEMIEFREHMAKKLGIEIEEDKVSFPWFSEISPEESLTYTKFISAICEMTVKQKRITAKPKANENEKYTFRCFLLRLGFIGDEFKADRKLLLSRLEGSSAFRNGQKGGEQ